MPTSNSTHFSAFLLSSLLTLLPNLNSTSLGCERRIYQRHFVRCQAQKTANKWSTQILTLVFAYFDSYLITKGADPLIKDNTGNSSLDIAGKSPNNVRAALGLPANPESGSYLPFPLISPIQRESY